MIFLKKPEDGLFDGRSEENYCCIITRLWKIIYRQTVLIVVSEHSSISLSATVQRGRNLTGIARYLLDCRNTHNELRQHITWKSRKCR